MSTNIVIIINFSCVNVSNFHHKNSDPKILSFCSMIIKLLLKKNLNQKIAVITNQGETAQQICHLTNNIFHHIQGLRRIIKTCFYCKNSIKSSIILAIRLINFTNQKNNSEILLISSEYDLNISIHFLGANLIKNKIKFSVIEFDKKSFIYETICKLTGGLYINYNLQERKQLFFWFKNKFFKNFTKFNKNYLSLTVKRIRFSNTQSIKKSCYLLKMLNYCPVCKTIKANIKTITCTSCGVLFLNSNFIESHNFKYIDLNIYQFSSIFNYDNRFDSFLFLDNIYKI